MILNFIQSILLNVNQKNDLIFNIKFWQLKMNDLPYCNAKFNHLHKVVDQIKTVCGRATGL